MCELLVGLPEVNVLGVGDDDELLWVHVESRAPRPVCPGCGGGVRLKDRPVVELVDLPSFGRRTRLVWRKHRWSCSDRSCPSASFTAEDARIAPARLGVTSRAGRWATEQVGRLGRSVNEIAIELGCDWHTANDTVIAYGAALLDADEHRIGHVEALGLDETLFHRQGPRRTKRWSTSIVDVGQPRLLDVVQGRTAEDPAAWLAGRGAAWCAGIKWATLDLSGPYRAAFDAMLPGATQVADPFHVVRLANAKLDECRRRVQNETLGHRGRRDDPLYRARRLLTKAAERLDEGGHTRLLGLLGAGDPTGDLRMAWHAKEMVRELYGHHDPELALEFVERLGADLQEDSPPEVASLGRTLLRWKNQIAAWHQAHMSNGPTEAMNNLIKRVKRVAFGLTNFRNFRIRALLYAGRPDWRLLASVTPR